MRDQTIKVGVRWTFNIQITAADIVDGFIVDHKSAIRMFQGSMSSQDRVVRLNDGSRNLRSGVDRELQLRLLAVVNGETFHQERSESGSGATSEGVEDQEALESRAVVGDSADSVEDRVDQFLSDGVVTTGIVVSGIFLSGNELLGVEKLLVSSAADFI